MGPMNHVADVIVIGGGLHGFSAALHLARRGVSAIVLEKDYVGRHASGVNAGGVRRLGRDLAEIPISVRATEYWQDIRGLVDDDCGYHESRQLKLAENEAELEEVRRRVDLVRQQGFEHEEFLDRDALRELEPAVAEHCVGALHVDRDGFADPQLTVRAFVRRAMALGVRVVESGRALRCERAGDGWRVETAAGVFSGGHVVNAAGAWAGRVVEMLGDRAPPVEAKAPMMAVTSPAPTFTTAVFGAMGDALSLKQYPDGGVLIGGGRLGRPVPDEGRAEVDMEGIAKSLATARRVFPLLEDVEIVRTWAGLEAYMPDEIPVIGPGSQPGVAHAFGFTGHGFQLAPAVGEIVADLVTKGASDMPIDSFRLDRFG